MGDNILQRIDPRPCAVVYCENTAHWSYDSNPICHECMVFMTDRNSDNEEAFKPALVQQGDSN